MEQYLANYTFWRQFLNCNIYPVGTYCMDSGRSFLQEMIEEHYWECWFPPHDPDRRVMEVCSRLRGGDVLLAKNSGKGVKVEAIGIVLGKPSRLLDKDRKHYGYWAPVSWVMEETRTIHDGGLGNLRVTIGEGIPIHSPVWHSPEHIEFYEKYILRARARFVDGQLHAINTVNYL